MCTSAGRQENRYKSSYRQAGRIHVQFVHIGRKAYIQVHIDSKQEGRYKCTVHIGQAGRKASIQVYIGRQAGRKAGVHVHIGRQSEMQLYMNTSAGKQEDGIHVHIGRKADIQIHIGRQVYIYSTHWAGRQEGEYTSVLRQASRNAGIYAVRPARMCSSVPLLEPGPPRFFWWYEYSE